MPADDDDDDDGPQSIDDFDPDEIDVQAIDAFHLGGRRFSASFELSDPEDEFGRSFLLDIDWTRALTFSVRLQVEDSMRSHVSFGPGDHVALELGGIVHDLPASGADTRTELPEGILTRLWAPSRDRVFAYGNDGVSYVRERGVWRQLGRVGDAVLNDMHGQPGGPVWMVGNAGVLVRLDGDAWQPLDIGREPHLQTVWAMPDGALYLGGKGGVGLELRNSELIELETEDVDYFDICAFKGRLYWSDMNMGVSVLEGQKVVPILETGQGFTMTATDDYLVVAGWPEVFLFDGKRWSGFELGFDGKIFLSELDMDDYG